MNLIQIYLPLQNNKGQNFPQEKFTRIEKELTERFGGLTAFVRTPADGFWKQDEHSVAHDAVVTFEVLTEKIDSAWWRGYREKLEEKFSQQEIMILATAVTRL